MPTVTPETLGIYLGRAALESVTLGEDSLQAHLRNAGCIAPGDEIEFFTDLALFAAFPLDVIVVGDFPEHADRISAAMRAHLLHGVNAMRGSASRPPIPPSEWDVRATGMFTALGEAWERAQAVPQSNFALAVATRATALVHGIAPDDARAATAMMVSFGMALRHFPAALAKFTLAESAV